jgi:hypothetical protein
MNEAVKVDRDAKKKYNNWPYQSLAEQREKKQRVHTETVPTVSLFNFDPENPKTFED